MVPTRNIYNYCSTRFANQGAARAVDWFCLAQYFTYFDVIFDTVLIMHPPTNGKPTFFVLVFVFCVLRDMTHVTDTMIRKKCRSDHNLSAKAK